jgi:plastocyanin
MRHLAPLVAVSALAASLIAPSEPLAADTADTFTPGTAPAPERPSGDAWHPDGAPAERRTAPRKPAAPRKRAARRKRVALLSAAAGPTVTIMNFSFSPATIDVKAGDTVTWRNSDGADHTATGKAFDTGVLSKGSRGSFTFKQAGTFSYVCTIHPSMHGAVRVAAASGGGESGGGSGGSGGGSGDGSSSSGGATSGGSTGGGSSSGGTGGSSGGAHLPRTGGDELALGGLGALLLALGAATQAGLARRGRAR